MAQHYPATGHLCFFCTNKTPEYEPCIMGMNMAVDLDVSKSLIMGDSDLIIQQAQGEWETRNIKLIPYKQHVEDLSKGFKSVEFKYITRFHNELADTLATLASMLPYPGQWRLKENYQKACKQFLFEWRGPIQKKSRSKSFEIHDDLIDAPPSELHHMSGPWPFVAWGMDVIGPIEPKSWHRFILVAIDYFTKWVEAVTFKAVTKKAIVDFVHSDIICLFGIPKTIITDNAANLSSYLMREVCEQFKITHRYSTPYRPKANGAIKAANKNIKKILREMVQGSRQWHKKFPFALLGYRAHQLEIRFIGLWH
ncbi:PREDICTED: uncharacterized protein LOC109224483 [Nicotiana attenuata]|uniref:uncharacterized protein LOC109224483 n=1 Tax=Nicotiana attenuata TaxID=49451 RepID=UPI00090573EE|nr:PREDICTED: uncharacterized protein LOC109224483 [Nicotiana attenuata]